MPKDPDAAKKAEAAGLELIKTRMPETYKSIKDRAAAVGNEAYAYVRRGLRGEPNCFYAFEAGHVVGTPFTLREVARDIAQYMVTFGVAHCCVWAEPAALPASK